MVEQTTKTTTMTNDNTNNETENFDYNALFVDLEKEKKEAEEKYNEMYINARLYMMNMESVGRNVSLEEAMKVQRDLDF